MVVLFGAKIQNKNEKKEVSNENFNTSHQTSNALKMG